jgi:hypothetical protein
VGGQRLSLHQIQPEVVLRARSLSSQSKGFRAPSPAFRVLLLAVLFRQLFFLLFSPETGSSANHKILYVAVNSRVD